MFNGTISQTSPTFINHIHVDVHYHSNMYLKLYHGQRGMCIKGLIWPPLEPKTAFHQFRPIGLLEEWFKCKILAFF